MAQSSHHTGWFILFVYNCILVRLGLHAALIVLRFRFCQSPSKDSCEKVEIPIGRCHELFSHMSSAFSPLLYVRRFDPDVDSHTLFADIDVIQTSFESTGGLGGWACKGRDMT